MTDSIREVCPVDFCKICHGIIKHGVCLQCGRDDDTPDFWDESEPINMENVGP
jgi:hypothetical protein